MRSISLASMTALSLSVALAACSQGDVSKPTTGTGGSTSSGSGGTSASGGSTGTGGSATGTGGTSSGSGGTTSGTGGTTAAGGTTGAGGTNATGGTTGAGGTNATGGGGGSSSSTGGAGGGSTGTGAGGGGGVSVKDVAGVPNQYNESLMSSFIIMPCYMQSQQDCITIPSGATCPNQNAAYESQGLVQTESFTLGGTSGTKYNMTFNVAGIAEAKYYMGGTRDGGTGPVMNAQDAAGTDTFYRGGAPVAVEHYNIYKMIVRNPDKSELAHYYLNSFPQTSVAYENHQTFPIKYTKTIPVVGGGSVDLYVSDSNCHAVDNCGPGVWAGTCTASRNVPETGLVIPTTYMGKNVSDLNVLTHTSQPFHAQLIHITVTAIAPM